LVDIRIYRAAFLPVLVALVTVMFSIQDRPPPLTSSLAPDAFDSKGAYETVREILRRAPDRRPGGEADKAIADLVEGRFQSLPGFETRRDEFSADVEGKDVRMTNVTGILSGPSTRQVVLIAHRDSAGRPGASSAADTAVLLELAKVLAGVSHEKTIVFVSTDGASADNAGARRLADHYAERKNVDAALVLEDVGRAFARRPFLVPWSTDSKRGSLQLARTIDQALRRELGSGAGSEPFAGQFMRQAWPLTLREQGPLVRHDMDAVTLTAAGEVPRGSGSDGLDQISRLRILHFGKAALATALALDASEVDSSPPSYLASGRKLVPGWAISLLAFALLAPALLGALDGFARARRRGRPFGLWLRRTVGAGVPFVVMLGAAFAFELLDWLPGTASEALAPATRPSFAEAAPPLSALLVVFVLAWLILRPAVIGPGGRELGGADPEASLAVALVLSIALLLLWFANPFATLLLVPAAHAALLFALPEGRNRPPLVIVGVGTALLLPLLVLLYYGARFDLGLDVSRYALLLVAGGGSLWNVVLVSLIAGGLLSLVLIAIARRVPEEVTEVTIRGPKDYAGPGSLGGTESALRR
jgi:hypothetical protein